MYDLWMAREKSEGWPWSFIIGRDGRIAFIGHPERLDQVLEEVLSGTYDKVTFFEGNFPESEEWRRHTRGDAATRPYRIAFHRRTGRPGQRWRDGDA